MGTAELTQPTQSPKARLPPSPIRWPMVLHRCNRAQHEIDTSQPQVDAQCKHERWVKPEDIARDLCSLCSEINQVTSQRGALVLQSGLSRLRQSIRQ